MIFCQQKNKIRIKFLTDNSKGTGDGLSNQFKEKCSKLFMTIDNI